MTARPGSAGRSTRQTASSAAVEGAANDTAEGGRFVAHSPRKPGPPSARSPMISSNTLGAPPSSPLQHLQRLEELAGGGSDRLEDFGPLYVGPLHHIRVERPQGLIDLALLLGHADQRV